MPLSELGRAQAAMLARALRDEPFERIYASDLARALETAQIVAAPHGIEVTRDERLREFDFGEWEGLTWTEIVAAHSHLRERGVTAARTYQPEGGESFAQVCARVAEFVNALRAETIQNAAVVTHAGVIHALLDVLDVDLGSAPVNIRPASITRLALERNDARLIALSDIRHLD